MYTVSYSWFSYLNCIVSASNAEVYARVLVNKTSTQLFSYNHDFNFAMYSKPVIDFQTCQNKWGYLTKDMSDLEIADMEASRDKLAHYEKIYGIIEYISILHDGITALEKRI